MQQNTTEEPMSNELAVLHGNYFARGGGERVADSIAETFDAPLYYGFGNPEHTPDDGVERIKLFHPNKISKALVRKLHQYRDFQFMWNGSHVPELFDYDVIIQSGNEFGWYIPKQMDQTIVKYVHSPPRGPYDMHYKHGNSALHRAYSLAAKTLYGHTTNYVDVYVANSEVVQKRCEKAWGISPRVVYPPVDVESYGPEHARWDLEDTYLTFGRLYRHKRTREIVQAFEGRDANLIVAGKGPQKEHLERIAPDNVDVRGYISEEQKRQWLAEVDALIFNAENEDFGIVPVEAFASGTPVIGVNDGFTKHQIQNTKNGYLYDDGTPEEISRSLDNFESLGVEWSTEKIARYADQFSRERFEREMSVAVKDAREASKTECKIKEPTEV